MADRLSLCAAKVAGVACQRYWEGASAGDVPNGFVREQDLAELGFGMRDERFGR